MEGIKCDKCGEFESQNGYKGRCDRQITFEYGWKQEPIGYETSKNTYDLCNDCRKELVDWVEVDE